MRGVLLSLFVPLELFNIACKVSHSGAAVLFRLLCLVLTLSMLSLCLMGKDEKYQEKTPAWPVTLLVCASLQKFQILD